MADLAQLGIVVNVSDQNAAQKLTALSTAADNASKSVDKLETASNKASTAISKVGSKRATDALNQTKKATDEVSKGYAQLLGDINKLDRAFAEVGKTQQGIKDLQKNLNSVAKEAKQAYEAGKLSADGYNRIGEASDKLALKLKEQKVAIEALNSGHYEAQKLAAKDAALKQEQIALEKLHAQAIKENNAFDKQRNAQLREAAALDKQRQAQLEKEQKNIAALNKFKEKQIMLQKELAADYAYHDREAQKYNETMGRMREAFDKVITRVKQFAAFIAAAAIVQAFTQSIRGAINIIIDFDQALKSLQAIAGATATEAQVMGDAIKQIAADTKFSAQEVAEGMQTIGKAGFSAGEALKMIQGVSNLATGALEDFNTVAGLVVTAIRAFGLEVVQTAEITDIFANAITKSKLSTESLVTAFGYVGAAGAQAGLTLNEVSGTLMVLSDNGIRASTMGTALRKTLLSMIAPNESLKNALFSVGMTLDDINPGIVGYEQALRNITPLVWDFEKATVDMAKAKEFFGIRASQVAAILIRETAQGGGISKAIESTKELGAALRMAEKQQEGLGVKFKNLSDSIKNVALAVGEAGLTNILHNVVDALKAVSTSLENIIKKYPVTQLLGYATAAGAIAAAIYGITNALKALVGSAAFKVIMGGFIATTFGKITLAISGVAAILTYLSSRLDDTSEAFKRNSIIINENVETIDGWIRTLENAKEKGIDAYNSALIRFTYENKELAKELVNVINTHDMLDGQMASSIEQVSSIAGEFQNYSRIVENALQVLSFEKAKESLDQFMENFKVLVKDSEKVWDTWISFGNVGKKEMKKILEEINDDVNEAARKIFEAAEKSGDADQFIENYLGGLNLAPEVLDAVFKQIQAIIESRSKDVDSSLREYLTIVDNRFKEHYKAMYDGLKEFQSDMDKIQSYIDENTLSTYDLEKKTAKETYDELIELAGNNKELKDQLEKAHQKVLADLWADELERRKKINDEIINDKEKQIQELIDLEVSLMKNVDAVNMTDKERRMAEDKKANMKKVEDILDAQEKASDKVNDVQKKEVSEYQKLYEKALENIQDEIADTFYDAFQGNIDSFEDMADAMLNIFKQMISQMLAYAVMNKITPIFGGMFGSPSLADGSGGFNIPGLSNIGKLFGLGGAENLSNAIGVLGQQTGLWGGGLANGISTYSLSSGVGAGQFGGVGSGLMGGGASTFASLGAGISTLGIGFLAGKLLSGIAESFVNADKPNLSFTGSEGTWRGEYGGFKGPGWYQGSKSTMFDYNIGVKDTGQDPQIQQQAFYYFDTIFSSIEETIGASVNDVLAQRADIGLSSPIWKGGSLESLSSDVFSELYDSFLTTLFPDDVVTKTKELLIDTVRSNQRDKSPTIGDTYQGFDVSRVDRTSPTTADVYTEIEYTASAMAETFNEAFFKAIAPEGGNEWDAFIQFSQVVKNTTGFMDDFNRRVEDLGQTAVDAYQQIQLVTGVMVEMDAAVSMITGSDALNAMTGMVNTWEQYIEVMRQAQATQEQLTEAEAKRNLVMGSQISGLSSGSIAGALKSGKTAADIASEALQTLINEQLAQNIFDDLTPILEDMGQVFIDTGGDIGAAIIALEQYTPAIKDLFDELETGIEKITGYDIQKILDLKNYGSVSSGDMWSQYQGVWSDYNINYDPNTQSGQANWFRWFTKSSAEEITGWIDTADIAGDEFVNMMKDIIDLERDLADARSDAKRSIEDLINDLTFSDLAPVTSMGRYQEQYNRLTSQIEGASTAEEVGRAISQFTSFVPEFLQFAAAFGGDYSSVYQSVMSDLDRYGGSFAGGGISYGPDTGYLITSHGAEAHVPVQNGSIPVVIEDRGGQNITVIVKVGEREMRDVTYDVIRTDPQTQKQIRRVANV